MYLQLEDEATDEKKARRKRIARALLTGNPLALAKLNKGNKTKNKKRISELIKNPRKTKTMFPESETETETNPLVLYSKSGEVLEYDEDPQDEGIGFAPIVAGALSIGKKLFKKGDDGKSPLGKLFGKKGDKGKSASSALESTELITLRKENLQFKNDVLKLNTDLSSAKMQRIYFGVGGLAIGGIIGYVAKRK